jgi:hypothetical protein
MIHGLSQRRTFVRGGKIRIGDKTTSRNGHSIPRRLDHFRFVPQDSGLTEHWQRLYGQRPTALPIMLPSNDRADIFPHEYRYWKGGRLFCHGDNRQAQRLGDDGTYRQLPCSDQCPFRYDPESGRKDPKRHPCKAEGNLRVLLPELPTVHAFEITARKLSIIRLNTCLDLIEKTCGQIGFIPLTLGLVPTQISIGDAPMTVYLLHLDVRVSLLELAQRPGQSQPFPLLTLPDTQATALPQNTTPGPTPQTQPLSPTPSPASDTKQSVPAPPPIPSSAQTGQTPTDPIITDPIINKNPLPPSSSIIKKQGNKNQMSTKKENPTRPPHPTATTSSPQTPTPKIPSQPEPLRAICRRLIDTLPEPQRQLLYRTLDNMHRPGDLKGFRAYLDGKVAPGRAA